MEKDRADESSSDSFGTNVQSYCVCENNEGDKKDECINCNICTRQSILLLFVKAVMYEISDCRNIQSAFCSGGCSFFVRSFITSFSNGS